METKQVIVLLDETGSMEPHQIETVQSFNGYLADLRKQFVNDPAVAGVKFWLTLFNARKTEARYEDVGVEEVADLTPETYKPNDSTPLYDAIMATIKSIEGKALMVIITDGEENASHVYPGEAGRETVKGAIKQKEAEGWSFLFLASTLDVALGAVKAGLSAASVTPTSSVTHAMRTASLSTQDYMAGRSQLTAAEYAAQARKDEKSKGWGGSS